MMNLPRGWVAATVADVAEAPEYGLTTKAEYEIDGPRFLRITDIQGNSVNWASVPRCECDHVDKYLLHKGDIVFARTGATTGKSFLIDDMPEPAVFASYLIRIRSKAHCDPRFLARFFQSKSYWNQIQEVSSGSAQPGVNASKLKDIKLVLPPELEQRRIVSKLNNVHARTKVARDELARIPLLIEHYKQAILRKAFTGELTADWRNRSGSLIGVEPRDPASIKKKYHLTDGTFSPPYELPPCWRWLCLPQLGDLDRGKSKHRPRNAPQLFGGPYPFIQTGEVRAADRYVTSYTTTYSESGLAQSRLWPKSTVCITIAANIAETAILGIEACFPDSIVGFTADSDRTSAEYIEFFLRTMKSELETFAPATAQKNINLDTLANLRIPVPPLDEQRQIIRRIEQAMDWLSVVRSERAHADDLLDHLNQGLLTKAFRGELVPQDPNEEPARESLNRIRMEHSANPPSKRRAGRK